MAFRKSNPARLHLKTFWNPHMKKKIPQTLKQGNTILYSFHLMLAQFAKQIRKDPLDDTETRATTGKKKVLTALSPPPLGHNVWFIPTSKTI